eukprot:TRINITY_DN7114_c0_g3_i1.p1 TRINITY_DN7114_c0_g3~~TRINITY_DN7114_c0_g3_i1.p1  ORF type:complete len:631 (+),score=115.93 TRINITY_DN7114_c0_g3_i1:2-1894(+)
MTVPAPAASTNGRCLTPGFSLGGIDFLKSEAKRSQRQQYDIGVLDDDLTFITSCLDPATVAAIKCEWERHGIWESFDCPAPILQQQTSAGMAHALAQALKDFQEKPYTVTTKGGRGRGKAKGPHKKFTEVLSHAVVLLDQIVQWKNTELAHRKDAHAAVKEVKNCTCWWSASPQTMCGFCRVKKKKCDVSHNVQIKKNENNLVGLRFQGEWVMTLTEITHGSPAADIPQLERFLEHVVYTVNGQPVAGKEVIAAIRRSGENVTLGFYHRYMDYRSSKAQYDRQLEAGRPPPIQLGPTAEDIKTSRAGHNRTVSSSPVPQPSSGKHKSHPLVEAPGSKDPSESAVAGLVRRWQAVRHPELLVLENLCKTQPDAWPAIFRFVTKSERNKEQLKAGASAIPPGSFQRTDLCAFYPPLVHHNKRNKLLPQFQKCVKLIESLRQKHPVVDNFMVVVDETKHGAPKYYENIPHPMDLYSIITRLYNQLYGSVDEVKADCDAVWSNCRAYNPETHWLHKAANDMERELNALWKKENWKGSKNTAQQLPSVPRLDYRSPTGKIFTHLESLPMFHSKFLRVIECLGESGYKILSEPVEENPGLLDIVVEIIPAAITEEQLREVINISAEKGQLTKKRKI